MKSTDLADATARALDLLPQDDAANSDPRMLRDPRLVGEARLTRETAAAVWLAVSPLRVAPPEVLQNVLAEIQPPAPAKLHGSRRATPWLAATGWAAAAGIAILLWPRQQTAITLPSSTNSSHKPTLHQDPGTQSAPPARPTPSTRDERQRAEIQRLRQQLALIRGDEPAGRLPRIIGLKAPGAADHSPDEVRKRVHLILTDALRSSLEAESGAPSDPASIVIERGWPRGGVPAPAEGETVRHRHFPEHAWQELGFLRSPDGEFYDAANHTVWSASLDGRGFTGRRAEEAGDLDRFLDETQSAQMPPPKKPRASAEGFIVENPVDGTADVIIDNLPAPAPGNKQVAIIKDTSGQTKTIEITPETQTAQTDTPEVAAPSNALLDEAIAPTASSSAGMVWWKPNNGLASMSANTSTTVFSIGSIVNMGSFKVIELPLVPNGQPATIIVESHSPP